MILGVGTDIVEIERIQKAMEKNIEFIDKLFTQREIIYFKEKKFKSEVVAGKFASKEAVSKALGTGFRGFAMKDIEILKDSLGKPVVNLSENIIKKFKLNSNYKVHISISHSRESAISYAILEAI